MIAVEFQGIVCALQDRCSISRRSQVTSWKVSGEDSGDRQAAVESLGRSLGTSRIAVKSLARVWGLAG